MTHTPGPWSVHSNPTSNYGVEVVAPSAIKAKRVVCRVGGPDREANARVLAVAPKMLNALERALPYLKAAILPNLDDDLNEHEVVQLVEVTIAEARANV